MIQNYLKIALRTLFKNKVFSVINILGLAIGMSSCLLILQYVNYELSYDSFHEKADRIYRIRYDNWQNGRKTFECAAAVPAVGPELKDNFPEVAEFTRLFPISGVVTYVDPQGNQVNFREEKMQVASPSTFDVFSFELLSGDPKTALVEPNKAVITKRVAQKYFKDEDPVGKMISVAAWGQIEYEVTGVMADLPENSHIKFDFLLSYETLNNISENGSETSWGWYDFNTYILLNEGVDYQAFQEKWDKHLEEVRGEDWKKHNYKQAFILQPLLDIHLYSDLLQESEPEEQGDGNVVYFLIIIAIFTLVIAWVNYVNLSTSRAVDRANEVGVRKTLGAYRLQLVRQFLFESAILNMAGIILAIIMVSVALPYFQELTGKPISFEFFQQSWFWLALAVMFLIGAFLSGFYPAIVLSGFQPVTVLKGKLSTSTKGVFLRKSLVVFQFGASVLLIAGTIAVYQQINFMLNQDLGFDIEQTLVIRGPQVIDSTYQNKLDVFKNEMIRESGVKYISASSNVPGNEIYWTRGIRRLQGGPENSTTIYNVGMDYDYLEAFDIEVLAGRNFSRDVESDKEGFILNESTARLLQFENLQDAIQKRVTVGGDTGIVIGVIADYHQMSLKNTTTPIVYRLSEGSNSFFSVKLETGKVNAVMEKLSQEWLTYFPGNPFEYFFLDDFFNRQYKAEERFGQVFSIFSILAIFIACLGLFGLSAFTAQQRTKEIGVRKVFGSSVFHILFLLSKEFVVLIIIAILIATPITYLLMDYWLNSFPYRIDINILLFLLAGGIVVIISLFTVSYQTVKAALANPIDSLRYE
ncbi:ABC transporter permease [Flexithrix dorotheae]|uniref:ABC transporter permease n=1 Tax=Flexithrix dorotheae TaxID=70993 RepID=UPI00036F8712|nr:ABC transporter permease [Flexithrix dorotheae]